MAHSQDRVPRGRASLPVGDSEWLWGANHWGEPRGVTAGDRQSPPRPQDSPPWPPRQRRHRPYSGPACATPPSESLRWLPRATERCPTRAEASAASALGSQPVCCWLSAPQPDGCTLPLVLPPPVRTSFLPSRPLEEPPAFPIHAGSSRSEASSSGRPERPGGPFLGRQSTAPTEADR